MKISELKNGQVVRFRTGLLHREAGIIAWEVWREGKIGVSVRAKPHGKQKAGVVALSVGTADFAPEHDYVPPHNFVTLGGEDYPNGYFMAEEYCLEIAGIEPGWEF